MANNDLLNTIKRLEKRISVLEDIEQIKELHRKYIYYVDQMEFEKVIDCFADEAIADLHGHYEGKSEIAQLFRGKISENLRGNNWGHFITQPVISVKGKTATGYWLFYCFMGDTPPSTTPRLWVQARHDCKYVKLGNEWKFSHLKFTAPWPKDFQGLIPPGVEELKYPE